MGADKPPVETVRRFLHLLEQGDIDFSEELGKYTNCAEAVLMYHL